MVLVELSFTELAVLDACMYVTKNETPVKYRVWGVESLKEKLLNVVAEAQL